MASVRSGELWIESTDEMTFDGDGWVTITVQPDGFEDLVIHVPPSTTRQLRDHKDTILRPVATEETE